MCFEISLCVIQRPGTPDRKVDISPASVADTSTGRLLAMLLAWLFSVSAELAMTNVPPVWTGQEAIAHQAESDLIAEAAAADKLPQPESGFVADAAAANEAAEMEASREWRQLMRDPFALLMHLFALAVSPQAESAASPGSHGSANLDMACSNTANKLSLFQVCGCDMCFSGHIACQHAGKYLPSTQVACIVSMPNDVSTRRLDALLCFSSAGNFQMYLLSNACDKHCLTTILLPLYMCHKPR